MSGENGHRRPLVPSDREQAMGKKVAAATAGGEAAAAEPRMSAAQMVGAYLRSLHPRVVTGGVAVTPLIVMGSLAFLESLDTSGLGVLFPFMRRDLHLSLFELGLITQTLQAPIVIVALFGGYIADRVNRVWLQFIGRLAQGATIFLTSKVTNAGSWLGVQAGAGIVGAATGSASTPLLADYYPPNVRGRVFGFLAILGGAGGLIAPLTAGILGDRYGWRPVFEVVGAVAVVLSFGFLLLRERPRGLQDRIALGVTGDALMQEQRPPGFAESWRASWSIRTLRRLWYASFFQSLGGAAIFAVLLVYLTDVFQVTPGELGLLGTLGAATGIIGTMVGLPLVDVLLAYKPGRVMTLLGLSYFISMVVLAIIILVPYLPVLYAGVLVLAFVSNPLNPATGALNTLIVPARLRGFGNKAQAPFTVLALLLSSGIFYVAGQLGYQAALAIGIPFLLVGGLLVLSASATVERDIRAARAASIAEEEHRRAKLEGDDKVLVCRDVDVHYGQVQILFNVDFDVRAGEMVALLGTNGAGKSTLLRAITGHTEASNGAIFLDGEDITHAPPHVIAQRGVVMVSGGRSIFPGLTVEDNLRAATWLVADDPQHVKVQMGRVLDEFFPVLKGKLGQKAGTLSGGEQQMLGLALAFLMKARLLLIDELSLGLAPAVVKTLLDAVREVNRQGTTVLLVEQSVDVALSVVERAVVLEKGEIQFDGTAAELRERPEVLKSLFLASARQGSSLGGGARAAATGGDEDARPEPVLQIEDIAVTYGGVKALNGVSLRAGAGEIVGLIGPNGAGKTTLFDAISGFIPLDAGRVTFAGRDVTAASPSARARMGLVRSFQDARLFPSMTVRENLVTALERHVKTSNPLASAAWLPVVRRQEVALGRRADRLIELFGLKDYEDKFVTELSTGVHRVVDLACVMAAEPEILLLDEPSAGLSQAETEEMAPTLLRLRRESGLGLVIIEHDVKLITAVADHLIALDLGRVVTEGKPDEVVNDPAVVRSYLGLAGAGAAAEMQSTAGGT